MRTLGLAVLLLLIAAAPAAAETYTVTGTSDVTGPCNGTSCQSIRQALAAAESSDGPDTIVVPAGEYGVNEVLLVDSAVTIAGAGIGATRVFMNPSSADRVFDVNQPVAVTFSNLTVAGGTGGFGGNLVSVGTTVLDHVRVTGGSASSGGGIANVGGTMTIRHSLVDGNQSMIGGGDSGAIANIDAGARLTVQDTTITGNRARLAGAMLAWGGADVVTRLVRVTIVGNEGGDRGIGGIESELGQTFTVEGSIIAGNTVAGVPSNCGAGPTSAGGNVAGTAECAFAAAGDVIADPQLGAFDGAVFPLSATSPAVDRAGACTGTDQRDLARPQGPACDSGAYELAVAPPPPPPATTQQQPEPEFRESVVVDEVRGSVRVKVRGSNRFVALADVRDLPLGSIIDTRKGTVELTSEQGAAPQTARFNGGIFRVSQTRTTTDLTLTEKLAPCGRGARAAAKKPKKRRLWGDGSGKFRTKGKHSAATVVGTKWLVQDSCKGTLTRVVRGKVSVRDQVKKKTVRLRAGQRYLARPPR